MTTKSAVEQKSPWVLVPVLILLAFGVSVLVQNVLLLLGLEILSIELSAIQSMMQAADSDTGLQNLLMLTQGLTQISSFIIVPVLFVKYYEKTDVKKRLGFHVDQNSWFASILVIVLVLVFMVVNSPIIEWNAQTELPGFMHDVAKRLEDSAKITTAFLTNFYSTPYFIFSLIVIAVIPAIGEELLFRGLLQNFFQRIFKNPHLAIWVTAILFSAIHMQFFGFLPRVFLGAIFGYLMFYSGNNIWYPIIGHFTNNGFTLLMLYLYQKGNVSFDIENTESFPLETVGIFAIMGVVLFVLYIKQFAKKNKVQL